MNLRTNFVTPIIFVRSRIPQQKPNPDLLNTSSTTEDSEYNNRASSRTSTHRSDPASSRKYSVADLNGWKGLERAPSSSSIHCFRQCCGSALKPVRIWIRIRIQHFLSLRIRIQIQGFDVQKLEKKLQLNKMYTCSSFKTWIFLTFVGHFGSPGFGSGSVFPMQIRISVPKWMRIRIRNTSFRCQLPCHPFPRSAYFQQLRILIRNIGLGNIPLLSTFFRSHEKDS